METKIYTYAEAARLLGLAGRSSLARRISSLEARGQPLTVQAGELVEFGSKLLLTQAGLDRLGDFSPRPAGRPKVEIGAQEVHQSVQ